MIRLLHELLFWVPFVWERMPNSYLNGGMGGEERCKLWRNRLSGWYMCVVRNRDAEWAYRLYYESWENTETWEGA